MKPIADSIGVLNTIRPRNIVNNQLKTLTPVGAAMIDDLIPKNALTSAPVGSTVATRTLGTKSRSCAAVAMTSAAFAGETYSKESKSVTPPPCPQWYADNFSYYDPSQNDRIRVRRPLGEVGIPLGTPFVLQVTAIIDDARRADQRDAGLLRVILIAERYSSGGGNLCRLTRTAAEWRSSSSRDCEALTRLQRQAGAKTNGST